MCIYLPFSDTFSVYLRPNVYIYVQMSIMSNGCGFLWVIRVLQTVGSDCQIRAVGPRKSLTGRIYHYFSDRPPNYTFPIYLHECVYLPPNVCNLLSLDV